MPRFLLLLENGQYTLIEADVSTQPLTPDGQLDVEMSNMVVIECGNIFDKQGAD